MLTKKGQALIEFVLLLPVILILIFSGIDVLNLILKKNDLSSQVNDQIVLLEEKKESLIDLEKNLESKNIDITFKENTKSITIIAKKEVSWISPITELILKRYTISIERVIPLG